MVSIEATASEGRTKRAWVYAPRVEEIRIAIIWLMAVRLLVDIVLTLAVTNEVDGFS